MLKEIRQNKPNRDGYVTKVFNGVKKMEHRLIWEEAYGPIPEGLEIHHKNYKRADNRLSNLELLTPLEHKRKHGGCYRNRKGDWIKPCTKCRIPKPLDTEFYKGTRGIHSECKACHIKRSVAVKKAKRARGVRC